MDELQDWEVPILADNLNYGLKDEWEMTRWIVCSVLRPYLKKGMAEKPVTDLFPLPTDKLYDESEIEITNEQVDTMKERIGIMQEKMKQQIQRKNNGKRS